MQNKGLAVIHAALTKDEKALRQKLSPLFCAATIFCLEAKEPKTAIQGGKSFRSSHLSIIMETLNNPVKFSSY